MNPYLKLVLKCFAVFVGSIGFIHGTGAHFDLATAWPGVVAVAAYLGAVADSTPAPWVQPPAAPKQ